MTTPSLDLLTQSLPENFSFYHLGVIALRDAVSDQSARTIPDPNDDRAALAYHLRGDVQATVVLLLEPGLDVSMYSEAGNIIASKLATILAEKHGVDVVISPPARLERTQLNLLASATQDIAEKTYVHSHAGKEVLLDALLLNYSAAKSPADGRPV
ncbi:MAG: chemotaxis protein CheC [Bdellovibrionia bacterium]